MNGMNQIRDIATKSETEAGNTCRDGALRNRGRMLIKCPDRPGIVATVCQFLFEHGANIVHSDQHSTDPWGGTFLMRIEFELPNLEQRGEALERGFVPIGNQFGMDWRLSYGARRKRIAIFVSKQDHCLLELLWQQKAGDLNANLVMVVSNHATLREMVESSGVPFHHVPVTADTKRQAEEEQLSLLAGKVDVVVLARYMQILSPNFVAQYPNEIINIHHSFLPAFVGANPYRQAQQRGVKLIGATAHYVTADLDAGPIIEQDVQRVDHRNGASDLQRMGRQIERVVLARAVSWHVDDRVLVHDNKTIVFSR
jgi:formyltetrahydrofolate deformylase